MTKLEEKKQEYMSYIKEHTGNVVKVWRYVKEDIKDKDWIDIYIYEKAQQNIINHDSSKYFDDEFEGYRAFFYPTDEEDNKSDSVRYNFEQSWNHHQKRNPHHWNYWVTVDSKDSIRPIDMPTEYILEMLCDWSAMSVKFGDLPSDYFFKNKKNMMLSRDTIYNVEYWLPIFDNAVKKINGENI